MNLKIKKRLRNILNRGKFKKCYEFASKIKMNKNKKKSDKEYIISRTFENTGIKPNLNNPEMLFEKVLWLKCYYRNPLMTSCTDKYEVKNYIEEKGYSHILIESYGVFNKFENINFSELPNKVFIKSTHTSGVNLVFEKNKTNYNKAKRRFNKSLETNYFYNSREWNYKNIKPRLIVEPYLDMNEYLDYKFFVINGKVEYFAVVKDINDEKGMQLPNSKFNLYYPDLSVFKGNVGRPKFEDKNFVFSEYINEMILIAEDLSQPFPYCRVDFLVSDSDFIFGEMTFYPNGGNMIIKPLELDRYYGDKLNLKSIKSEHIKMSEV